MVTGSSPAPKAPHVTIDAEAYPLLVSDMAKMRDGILSLIQAQMEKSDIPVHSIRISLKNSPEEDRDELVFRINVECDPDDAFAFWDSVGDAISEWRLTLSKRKQRLLDEKIGVFVEW